MDYPQQNHSRVLHSITALFSSARTEWVDKQELNSSCIDRINALFIGNAFSTFNYLASAPLIESNAASSNPYVFETEIFLDTNRPSVHTQAVIRTPKPQIFLKPLSRVFLFLDPTSLVNSCRRLKPDAFPVSYVTINSGPGLTCKFIMVGNTGTIPVYTRIFGLKQFPVVLFHSLRCLVVAVYFNNSSALSSLRANELAVCALTSQ